MKISIRCKANSVQNKICRSDKLKYICYTGYRYLFLSLVANRMTVLVFKGMRVMRILFCDDEIAVLRQLQSYLTEYFHRARLKQPEYAAYTSGDQLLENEKGKVDIAFLDVEMPGRSGIHVGKILMDRNPKVKIFIVTSFPDYLDEAMHFHVFRYLSKPINKERLFYNLKDAIYQYNMENISIPVETKSRVNMYSADDIVCVEATNGKIKIHTLYGSFYAVKGMTFWIDTLNYPCFYAAYRSYIVNFRYVTSFTKTLIQLQYGDKKLEAYLARRKYTDFKNKFLLYQESIK